MRCVFNTLAAALPSAAAFTLLSPAPLPVKDAAVTPFVNVELAASSSATLAGKSPLAIAALVHAVPLLRRNLPETPDEVSPVPPFPTPNVPVAMLDALRLVRFAPLPAKLVAVTVPWPTMLPLTSSFSAGEVVPSPTLPVPATKTALAGAAAAPAVPEGTTEMLRPLLA